MGHASSNVASVQFHAQLHALMFSLCSLQWLFHISVQINSVCIMTHRQPTWTTIIALLDCVQVILSSSTTHLSNREPEWLYSNLDLWWGLLRPLTLRWPMPAATMLAIILSIINPDLSKPKIILWNRGHYYMFVSRVMCWDLDFYGSGTDQMTLITHRETWCLFYRVANRVLPEAICNVLG